jgi:hypothetical protein
MCAASSPPPPMPLTLSPLSPAPPLLCPPLPAGPGLLLASDFVASALPMDEDRPEGAAMLETVMHPVKARMMQGGKGGGMRGRRLGVRLTGARAQASTGAVQAVVGHHEGGCLDGKGASAAPAVPCLCQPAHVHAFLPACLTCLPRRGASCHTAPPSEQPLTRPAQVHYLAPGERVPLQPPRGALGGGPRPLPGYTVAGVLLNSDGSNGRTATVQPLTSSWGDGPLQALVGLGGGAGGEEAGMAAGWRAHMSHGQPTGAQHQRGRSCGHATPCCCLLH